MRPLPSNHLRISRLKPFSSLPWSHRFGRSHAPPQVPRYPDLARKPFLHRYISCFLSPCAVNHCVGHRTPHTTWASHHTIIPPTFFPPMSPAPMQRHASPGLGDAPLPLICRLHGRLHRRCTIAHRHAWLCEAIPMLEGGRPGRCL